MADLKDGARALDKLSRALESGEELLGPFLNAVLAEAKSRGSSRPTPQAPMASSALVISGNSIGVLSEGTPQDVSGGSEWGSDIYTQFGPRNNRGWWLMPSTESSNVLSAGDAALENVIQSAIRGF